jgi:hypothetical protein
VKVHTGFWWGNVRERDHLEEPYVDGRVILSWIFKKWDGGMDWIDLAPDRDTFHCGNELLGSITCGGFLN